MNKKTIPHAGITNFVFVAFLMGIACSVLAQDNQQNPNLFKNGSFEQGTEGWNLHWITGKGQAHVQEEGAADGQKYLDINPSPAIPSRLKLNSPSFPVVPGKTYEFSFQYFTSGNVESGSSVRLTAYDEHNTFSGYYSSMSIPPTANVWVTENGEFTAPENAAHIVMEFNFSNGVRRRLDNVRFYERVAEAQVLQNTLFEELLIPGSTPEQPRLMPYWGYDVSDAGHYRSAALRYGHEYVLADRFKELGERRWAPFDNNGLHRELRRQFNVKTNYYIYAPGHFMDPALKLASERGADGVNKDVKNPSPVDPTYVGAVVELFKNKSTLLHDKDRVEPGFFMFADELYGKTLSSIPVINPTSEFWKNADDAVRKAYGFGKFGIPTSREDEDSFRWIAYQRWQSDLAVEAVGRIAAAAKEVEPDVPFMGTDEYAAPTPFDWERIGQHVDIQMHQSLPSSDGWRSYNPGYVTKFMRDLSGKPVYPFIQIIKYGLSPSPTQVHNWVDQTLRAGAEGLFVGAVEWFDRDLNHPRYAAPEKWDHFVKLAEQVQRLPRIKYPEKSEVALHYSSYTHMARRGTMDQSRFASAYAFLGPRAGTWFTVTDDFQVDRDITKWNQYKIVVVPEAIYVSQDAIQAMQHYTQQGGTLILSDPDSLSWRIDGEDPKEARHAIQGIVFGESTPQREIVWGDITLRNAATDGRGVLQMDTDVKVLATFSDGTPAIVEHPIGKGRVISFAFNPHSNESVANDEWRKAWRQLLQAYNVETDLDIWRFSLPTPETIAQPTDICVTGNAIWMQRNKPVFSSNSDAGGSYWYEHPPQALMDAREGKDEIPFAEGKLTNRVAIAKTPKTDNGNPAKKEEALVENYIVRFGANETNATTITFKLNQAGDLTRSRIVASGLLPRTNVQISSDGKIWQDVGVIESVNADADVVLREVPINAKGQFVRFHFAERAAESTLTLSEIDIWADKQ